LPPIESRPYSEHYSEHPVTVPPPEYGAADPLKPSRIAPQKAARLLNKFPLERNEDLSGPRPQRERTAEETFPQRRGLVEGSVVLRARVARLFLGELSDPIEAALAQLRPGDVTRFVVAQCGDGRRGTAWASTLVSGLRSLLVFLHVTGGVPVPLAAAVPSVASWRLISVG
jgi:hypothetical protein